MGAEALAASGEFEKPRRRRETLAMRRSEPVAEGDESVESKCLRCAQHPAGLFGITQAEHGRYIGVVSARHNSFFEAPQGFEGLGGKQTKADRLVIRRSPVGWK